jgi:hypothetical protein
MKLEASPIGDSGGMAQVHTKLASLMIQLVELTKGKEKWEQVSFTKCNTEFHQRTNAHHLRSIWRLEK